MRNRYKIKKNEVYKINLPSDFEDIEIVINNFDFSNFKNISILLNSFSFDGEKFDSFILHQYIQDLAVDKSFLYFYEEKKKLPIKKLSTKEKIILNLITIIDKYDCFLFSLEALSVDTQLHLIFLFNYLTNYKYEKTFICFDYLKKDYDGKKIEINLVRPSWKEDLLVKLDFSE
ncbi:hypothetical protein [Flavobacterium anhuiense]|uniref:hypothetical protein n=1 Tax=Flavobacterium anhuiense TaxID=459526 RepID=UPI000E6BDB35|nr:hypothetical protein [Flavobacterium anhuiense]